MHLQLLNTAPEVWLKPAYAPVAYGSPPYVPSLRIVFAERRQARGLRHFLLRCSRAPSNSKSRRTWPRWPNSVPCRRQRPGRDAWLRGSPAADAWTDVGKTLLAEVALGPVLRIDLPTAVMGSNDEKADEQLRIGQREAAGCRGSATARPPCYFARVWQRRAELLGVGPDARPPRLRSGDGMVAPRPSFSLARPPGAD